MDFKQKILKEIIHLKKCSCWYFSLKCKIAAFVLQLSVVEKNVWSNKAGTHIHYELRFSDILTSLRQFLWLALNIQIACLVTCKMIFWRSQDLGMAGGCTYQTTFLQKFLHCSSLNHTSEQQTHLFYTVRDLMRCSRLLENVFAYIPPK